MNDLWKGKVGGLRSYQRVKKWGKKERLAMGGVRILVVLESNTTAAQSVQQCTVKCSFAQSLQTVAQ